MNVSGLGIDIGKNKFHCYNVDDKDEKVSGKVLPYHFMLVLNTVHHPGNRETTVLLRPKDLHRPSLAGLVVFVAFFFNCQGLASSALVNFCR